MIEQKRILLAITGGIAAYKSAELVRLLKQAGFNIKVLMTDTACQFITPLTMQALSGKKVSRSLLSQEYAIAMEHIELANWADFIIIAPATANFIAKAAHGLADDLLSTLILATTAPIALAPAMNQCMYSQLATQDNLNVLQKRGFYIYGPEYGEQACGDCGHGRMLAPEHLLAKIKQHFTCSKLWSGIKIMVTAGPTHEAWDPVCYLTNHSSGKMGYALAKSAIAQGAEVTLISGPVNLSRPADCQFVQVTSALDMYRAVMEHVVGHQLFIGCAAVADYRPAKPVSDKIKKVSQTVDLQLVPNIDIIAEVGKLKDKPFTVGFAAETQNITRFAIAKMQNKGLNMIAANYVGLPDQGFASAQNALTLYWPKGSLPMKLKSKELLAHELLTVVHEHYLTYDNGRQHG